MKIISPTELSVKYDILPDPEEGRDEEGGGSCQKRPQRQKGFVQPLKLSRHTAVLF